MSRSIHLGTLSNAAHLADTLHTAMFLTGLCSAILLLFAFMRSE
jgi:hypothetical protein